MATISDGKWNYSVFTWYDYDLQTSSFSKILDDKTIENKGITEDSFFENELYIENTEENKTKYDKDEYTMGYLLLSDKKYYGYIKKTMLVLIGGDIPQQPYPTHTTIKEQTEKTEQLKTTLDSKVDSIGNIINTKIKEKPTTLTQVEDALKRKMLGIGDVVAETQLEGLGFLTQGSFTGHTNTVYALTSDNEYIYSGSGDGTVRKIRKSNMAEVSKFTGHTNTVYALTSDNEYIYSGGWDGTVRKIRKSNMAEVGKFTGRVSYVRALTIDSEYIYSSGSDGTVSKIRKSDMVEVNKFTGHNGYHVYAITLDNEYIYSSGASTVRKIRKSDMVEVNKFIGHTDYVRALTSDNEYIYSGSDDKTVRKWAKTKLYKILSI